MIFVLRRGLGMKILSLNVGLPRPVSWRGRRIMTGIFKEPVEGRVRCARHNLEGDGQADLSVHGGPEKAVYAYPSEHYPYWRRELELEPCPGAPSAKTSPPRGGGRTRSTSATASGSARRSWSSPSRHALLQAGPEVRPRRRRRALPRQRAPGHLPRIVQEGEIGAGDAMERIHEDENGVTVVDVIRLISTARGAIPTCCAGPRASRPWRRSGGSTSGSGSPVWPRKPTRRRR